MSNFIDLYRSTYLKPGVSGRLNYLSAHYKNIKFQITPTQVYTVSITDRANAPGIAYSVYGDKGYWWVVCMYTGVLDPITAFVPGRTLLLPSLSDINLFLGAQTSTTLGGIGSVINI